MRTKRIALTALVAALTVAATAFAAAPSGATSAWTSPGAGIKPPTPARTANGAFAPHATPGVCEGSLCDYDASMYLAGTTSTGMTAMLNQSRPNVVTGERSATMISIGTADDYQAIVYGWMVSKAVYHDTLPHFMTNAVVNGTPHCLNDCGFVHVTKTLPTITPGKLGKFTIKLSKGRWLIVYNGATIGYYRTSLWPGNKLSRNHLGVAFGSVSSPSRTTPRSDMGNGKLGTNNASAKMVGVSLLNSQGAPVYHYQAIDAPAKYNIGFINPACHKACNMNYGGPGF